MYHINPSREHIEIFKKERMIHPIPKVQTRMEALWLKYNKVPHNKIAELADISVNTVTNYIIMYNEGGVDKLREVNFHKPQSELINFKTSIEAYFKEHPPCFNPRSSRKN